jgi:DNA-binding CsgD family transcriptional regulator
MTESDQAGFECPLTDAAFAGQASANARACLMLTPRQLDVLRELARVRTSKRIAKALSLSPGTVNHHLKAIFAKFGLNKRKDVVTAALSSAIIS